MQGASEALRGTLNYSIDKRFSRTDPAVLERERQTIEKGKAQIDPRYMEKFNEKMNNSGWGATLSGVLPRKPVAPTSAAGGAPAAAAGAYGGTGKGGQQSISELEG